MKEFLKPLYLLQLIPKAWRANPLSDSGRKRHEERKNKALEGGGKKKMGEAETAGWYQ